MLSTKEVHLLSDFTKPLIELADMYESNKVTIVIESAEEDALNLHCYGNGRKYTIKGIPMKLIRRYSDEEIAEAESFCGVSSRKKSLEVALFNRLYLFLKSINDRGIIPNGIHINITNGNITSLGVSS